MKANLLFLFLLASGLCFSQHNQQDWTVTPFSDLGFSENRGRYEDQLDEQVRFHADFGQYKVFLSNDAIVLGRAAYLSEDEWHERYEKIEHGEAIAPIEWTYFKIEFLEANAECFMEARAVKSHKRHFQNPENPQETVKVNAYDVLVYKELYPNIDLQLELPKSGGLKYNFIVHPGGDYTQIRMKYSGVEVELLESGDLKIVSQDHSFNDMMPISEVTGEKVNSQFVVSGNEVKFDVEDYDTSQILIIDPWLVTDVPVEFTLFENNYNVAYDDMGNCIMTGRTSAEVADWKMASYNSDGELNWVYESLPGSSNDVVTKPSTGDIFSLTFWYPGSVSKIDITGTLISGFEFNYAEGETINPVEGRALAYNRQHDEICIGQGGLYGDFIPLISRMDMDISLWDTYEVLVEEGSLGKDPVLFDIDPDGGSVYFVICYGPYHDFGNKLFKVDYEDPDILLWETNSGHLLSEATYERNGLAAGVNYLYTVVDDKLKKWDKDTGEALDSLIFDVEYTGGIDTDKCGNVYVGFEDSIVMINSDLTHVHSFDVPGECTDIMINGNLMYACGVLFVTQINLDVFEMEVLGVDDLCGTCSGSAWIDTTMNCHGYELAEVYWSPGEETTPEVNGLCPGWYEVTTIWVSELGDIVEKTDSIEVIPGEGSDITLDLGNDTTICEGDVIVLNAGADFTAYLWQDGSTSSELAVDVSGWYWVEVEDTNGCTQIDSVEVNVISCLGITTFESNLIQIYPNPSDDRTTIYFGQELQEEYAIILCDINGKEVFSQGGITGDKFELDLTPFSAGNYVISIVNKAKSKEVFSSKLTIE